ncbi:hypothetical protein [Pseudomonas sp. JAI120]|uniref:hypothetical protein n=1 Tax=Pseudomonas sp. JAI120 TaxID=2723063 RepID=UPI0030D8BB09
MHPKNSTTLLAKQAPLLTTASEFHQADTEGKHFFTVTAGLLVSDVLNEASTILSAVESVAGKLQDGDLDANDIYLIRLMVGAAQSLINASTSPVEFGNRGGAK